MVSQDIATALAAAYHGNAWNSLDDAARDWEAGRMRAAMNSTGNDAEDPHASLVPAARKLVDAVSFDVNGIDGRGGNGGLTSSETIRASDELRMMISRHETATPGKGRS